MFDFRYHAVSLAAVLVALAVGVLLGVAIGDAGLVSSAEKQVRASLRDDVRGAQAKEQLATDALVAEQRYSRASYPFIVSGRLQGAKVGLLFLGEPDEAIAADVRSALTGTGAELSGTLAVKEPPDTAALAAAGGPRYSGLSDAPQLLTSFGKTIGRQLILGGQLLRSEADSLFSTRAGGLGPFDAVVVVRIPRTLTGEDATNTNLLEDGLMAGLTKTRSPTVGVQTLETTPTQVPWYRERGLSSVNNVGQTAGQAALVLSLAGAQGSFGVGPDVGGLLPGPELASG